MNTKRILTGAIAVAFVGALGFAPHATADPGAVTGTGADGEGNEQMNDPSGDTATAEAGPVSVYTQGEPGGTSGGVGVAVGQEDTENSLGKAAVGGSQEDGAIIYAEDYTDGDQVANTVEDGNQATGCNFLPPDEGTTCEDESDDDAVTIYSEAPAEE